jgi:hypothetical protein
LLHEVRLSVWPLLHPHAACPVCDDHCVSHAQQQAVRHHTLDVLNLGGNRLVLWAAGR